MKTLREEITDALNRHSAENVSETPDFILGIYLINCLQAFDNAVQSRERYYNRKPGLHTGQDKK